MIDKINYLWSNDWITVEGVYELLDLDDIEETEKRLEVVNAYSFNISLRQALENYINT